MSQSESIARYLTRGHSLTPLSALNLFGVMRLAARISELKHGGFSVKTEMVWRGKRRFARYSWAKRLERA